MSERRLECVVFPPAVQQRAASVDDHREDRVVGDGGLVHGQRLACGVHRARRLDGVIEVAMSARDEDEALTFRHFVRIGEQEANQQGLLTETPDSTHQRVGFMYGLCRVAFRYPL